MAGFEQAAIKVENEQVFQELRDAIERALSAAKVEQFLKRLESRGVRIRDFEAVLNRGVLEQVDETLARERKTASGLYQALSVSDQGQMREFYLSRIEGVDLALRARFQKLYRYY
jgi:hypothetical protein